MQNKFDKFEEKSERIRLALFQKLCKTFEKFVKENELENHSDLYGAYKCAACDFLGVLMIRCPGDDHQLFELDIQVMQWQLRDMFLLNFREQDYKET